MEEFKPPAEIRSSGLKFNVAKADTTEVEQWIKSSDNTPLYYKHPMRDMVLDNPPKNVAPKQKDIETCQLCEGFLTEHEGYACFMYDTYCFDCWDKNKAIKP